VTIYFPDVSAFQAGIDLAGAKAVAIKATEGTSWHNPDYSRAKTNAAGHGAFVMAYHFLHDGAASVQANWCHGGGPGWGGVGGTPLMIDCEPTGTSRPGLADVAGFIDNYRKLGGTTHLVYLPHWYWQQLGSPSLKPLEDRNMALWSSAYTAYTDNDTGTGWQPYGGMRPKIWQYTDRLHFNGHDIDFNAFKGTHPGDQSGAAVKDALRQLEAVAKTGKIPPAQTQAPVPPAKRTASGKESFRHAVNREATTVARGLWLMARDADKKTGYGPLQSAYVRRGDWNAVMPRGMVYWVG